MSTFLSDIGVLIADDDVDQLSNNEGLLFDDSRREILQSTISIDVQACPGSGKTTLIAAKLILLAKKWPYEDKGICVLSHTNVAKEEIISRLKASKTKKAQKLLSYPHFVGTIQEFVNRYLSLPFLRSLGVDNFKIDQEHYINSARTKLKLNSYTWLANTMKGWGGDEPLNQFIGSTFRQIAQNGEVKLNISKKPKAWSKEKNFNRAIRDLNRLKDSLENDGCFLFRDMYTYGSMAVRESGSLSKSLVNRFPIVLVDEMQDTQKFQDDLLNQVFSQLGSSSIIQRFGDPDQAIFQGINNEEPNDSFNRKSREEMDFVIDKSHRFDSELIKKIKGLSLNEIFLGTEITQEHIATRCEAHRDKGLFDHTVFIFNDDTSEDVLLQYCNLISEQFSNSKKLDSKFCVKAVGAVGNEIDPKKNELKIGHYWPIFDKSKSRKNYRADTLIELVFTCRNSPDLDWSSAYKDLVNGILKFLMLAEVKDANGKSYSSKSIKEELIKKGEWRRFRMLTWGLLSKKYPLNSKVWARAIKTLTSIFSLDSTLTSAASIFLAFKNLGLEIVDDSFINKQSRNLISHPDGFSVELSTIHSVKGETHDATLLLETKRYSFDLGVMMPYMIGDLPDAENKNIDMVEQSQATKYPKPSRKFMRQLYVAASRPKHLLCIAIHEDRIDDGQITKLKNVGWKINFVSYGD